MRPMLGFDRVALFGGPDRRTGSMGIFDKLKQHKDDADGAVETLKDKAGPALDKAGEVADEKTGGKFSDQIHKGVDKAKQAMGQDAPEGAQPAEQPAGASPDDDTQAQPPAS